MVQSRVVSHQHVSAPRGPDAGKWPRAVLGRRSLWAVCVCRPCLSIPHASLGDNPRPFARCWGRVTTGCAWRRAPAARSSARGAPYPPPPWWVSSGGSPQPPGARAGEPLRALPLVAAGWPRCWQAVAPAGRFLARRRPAWRGGALGGAPAGRGGGGPPGAVARAVARPRWAGGVSRPPLLPSRPAARGPAPAPPAPGPAAPRLPGPLLRRRLWPRPAAGPPGAAPAPPHPCQRYPLHAVGGRSSALSSRSLAGGITTSGTGQQRKQSRHSANPGTGERCSCSG